MVWCECGAIAIDGGSDYTKITGNKEDVDVLVPESKLLFQLAEKNKIINNLLNETQDLKKVLQTVSDKLIKEDKISFALEQLEEVKAFCDGMKWAMVHLTKENTQTIQTVLDEIDNQIKQLTHQQEDKGE